MHSIDSKNAKIIANDFSIVSLTSCIYSCKYRNKDPNRRSSLFQIHHILNFMVYKARITQKCDKHSQHIKTIINILSQFLPSFRH